MEKKELMFNRAGIANAVVDNCRIQMANPFVLELPNDAGGTAPANMVNPRLS